MSKAVGLKPPYEQDATLDWLEEALAGISSEKQIKSWHHEMSDPVFVRCWCVDGELRRMLPGVIERVRHLERKLRTIKNLTQGSREVEGLFYLADSALRGK